MQKGKKKCGLLSYPISIFNYSVLLFSFLTPCAFAKRFSLITHCSFYVNYGDLAIFKKIPISPPPFYSFSFCRSISVLRSFSFVILWLACLVLFYGGI